MTGSEQFPEDEYVPEGEADDDASVEIIETDQLDDVVAATCRVNWWSAACYDDLRGLKYEDMRGMTAEDLKRR